MPAIAQILAHKDSQAFGVRNISSVDFSLGMPKEKDGIASVNWQTGELTIFLMNFEKAAELLGKDEDAIDELVIHEILHLELGGLTDKIIDFWHVLICRLDNPDLPQARDCSCPITCFWRDVYSKV